MLHMENRKSLPSLNNLYFICLLLACYGGWTLAIDVPGRKLSALVPSAPIILQYHKGPLLSGPKSINVYILWYGKFAPSQKATISDFVTSLGTPIPTHPSVSSWWATTERYTDSSRKGVSRLVKIGGQASDALYSLGKTLKRSQIGFLVRGAVAKTLFPFDAMGVYMVLTADDVYVERFCMNSCGFHESTPLTRSQRVLIGWVGNAGVQCAGQCAWPFAAPLYGPPTPPLIPPNGDVGVDGMIINIATILAGAATNPYNSGYYQGSALAPLEAVTACSGIYGKGAYPGYPGDLLLNNQTKASYNTYGVRKREFLLPGMWEPSQRTCKTTV